jgi:hypothetical protein
MKISSLRVAFIAISLFLSIYEARAQQISGISTLSFVSKCTRNCSGPPRVPPVTPLFVREVQAYADTEEDYTASLYYDVQSTSAGYLGGGTTPLATVNISGNPTATATYVVASGTTEIFGSTIPAIQTGGLYSEVTDHFVDCFYVSSVGEYYDPYDFSIINNNPDGDYDSGYWFSVDVYGTYIAEASVLLGEDWDATSDPDNKFYQGPTIVNVMYQAFIPPDNVPGPPDSSCTSVVYAGDNRVTSTGAPIFIPTLGSFRAMQAISVGVGGYTSIYPANAPPAEATGWTFNFSSSILQSGIIPPSAYNYQYLGACSTHGINDYGKANTNDMDEPGVIYNGSTSTQTTLSGAATNPIPLISLSIDWDIPLTFTEPSNADLHVNGTLNADCYPAHEVSIGGTDIPGGTWSPTSNSLGNITTCLSGVGQIHQTINADIPLVPATL